jgi:hypothetical protein
MIIQSIAVTSLVRHQAKAVSMALKGTISAPEDLLESNRFKEFVLRSVPKFNLTRRALMCARPEAKDRASQDTPRREH